MNRKDSKFVYVLRHNKAFLITSAAVIAFFTTASSVCMSNLLISNTFDSLFGASERKLVSGNPAEAQYYRKDDNIKNKADSLANANSVNQECCEEGFVLLKNQDNALPLSSSARVSVFGMNSVNLVYGGSGSSAKGSDGNIDIYRSLEESGIAYNPDLKAFYEKAKSAGKGRPASPNMGDIVTGFATGELPLSEYPGGISRFASGYSDAALMVISRIGGEGYDLPTTSVNTPGRSDPKEHYLELDDNEKDLLKALCAEGSGYEKVILLINCGTSMELGFLKDDVTYHGKLKAALWMGTTGGTGMRALGRILKGEVNPSGHLVDTYASDFTKTPSWNNFSTNVGEGNSYYLNGTKQNAHFTDYEEGIYVGYRYYETRAVTDGEEWYRNNVVFPFGYGLSYTNFSWSIEEDSSIRDKAVEKGKTYTIKVKVTNDGDRAGKDVVQIYGHAPYTKDGIEKSEEVLLGFEKTAEIKPGESKIVEVTIDPYYLASYDYKKVKSPSGGYVLEGLPGYKLYVSHNAHDKEFEIPFTVSQDIFYKEAFDKDTQVENRFDDVSAHIETYLSRSAWDSTFPTRPTEEEKNVTEDFIQSLSMEAYIGQGNNLDLDKPWYSERKPRQKRIELSEDKCTTKIWDLIGKDYDDKTWDLLLNQLTYEQMSYLIGTGNYHTSELRNIGLPGTTSADGPAGLTNFMTVVQSTATIYDACFYASETVIGSTWNRNLAEKVGNAIGNECLIGNERGDGKSYTGWYAPAVNIHRSQFGGRNWEYFSEDPFLSGFMAAGEIQGARAKGVNPYVKHFAVNDQETNRDTNGLITWLNEQAMREIYLRPFEIAVKVGKTNAVMSSFNRIGSVWTGGCYELLTDILRKEWGFHGCVLTDYNTNDYMYADQMIRAGGDLNLMQDKRPSLTGDIVTPSHQTAMRKATKNILYMLVNSNAMNGIGKGIVYRNALPVWKTFLIVLDCVVAFGLAVWGFFSIRHSLKKRNEETKTDTHLNS